MTRSRFASDHDGTAPVVLVVHPEEDLLAYLSDAMGMFEPSVQVATATTFLGAVAWLESLRPDLLIAEAEAVPPDELARFVHRLALPRHRVILLGGDKGQLPDAVIADDRPSLSTLLRLVSASFGARRQDDDGFHSDADSVVAS